MPKVQEKVTPEASFEEFMGVHRDIRKERACRKVHELVSDHHSKRKHEKLHMWGNQSAGERGKAGSVGILKVLA